MKIVIIGAGVVGSALACRAATAGLAVTVVEAGVPGHGTSAGSFAWLNAHDKQPRAYHDLTVRALAEHRALGEELGDAGWSHSGGAIEWVAGAAAITAQQDRVARLQAWGVIVEWLDTWQLRELEPDIAPEAVGDAPVAFYPGDGWVDPAVFVHANLRHATRHGAVLRRGTAAARLLHEAGRVRGVELAGGERIEADLTIACTGALVNTLIPAPLHLPLTPKRGLTAVTQPVPTGVRRVVKAAQCYLRPDGAGRLLLHGKAADQALTDTTVPAADLPAVDDLLDRAATVVPDMRGAAAEAVRIVTRPFPADGFPAVGPVGGLDGLYTAVMHSGVVLAPLMARLIVTDITSATGCADLARYRPDRFRTGPDRPAFSARR